MRRYAGSGIASLIALARMPNPLIGSRAPYKFGVKTSIVTTNARAPGGQFVLHAKALPSNSYDGHTLGDIIEATEKLTGCPIEPAYAIS
jgi:hypothetical protein